MTLKTQKYEQHIKNIPELGNHILAHQEQEELVVYQAFKTQTANYAINNQKFGGETYSFNRMTWIKPNFLWMMYRSGWASKVGQEHILAIWMNKSSFDEILANAAYSSYNPNVYEDREAWKADIENKEVRLQWDPDHDPYGNKQDRRAIQLGLKGKILKKFNEEYINKIEDISDFVNAQRKLVEQHDLSNLIVPKESVYLPNDNDLINRLELN